MNVLGRQSHVQTKGRKLTKIVRVLPTEAHLQIVVLNNKTHEPFKEMGTLLFSNFINLLHMVTNGENTLPSSHWVGADHRVLCA